MRESLAKELLENFHQNSPRWKSNLTTEERTGLRDLKENPTVRVLATDKNLGPALVTTDDWTLRRQKVIETRDKLVNSYSRFWGDHGFNVKSVIPKIRNYTFSVTREFSHFLRVYFVGVCCLHLCWNVIFTIMIRYKISSYTVSCSNSLTKSVLSDETGRRK